MLMVFHKAEDGQWSHHQNIFNPYTSESNHFGDDIVFSGNTMFVSAANTGVKDSHSGEVLVYTLSDANQWHHQDALFRKEQLRSNEIRSQKRTHNSMRFGHKIAADDNWLVAADVDGLHIYGRNGEV